MFASLKNLCIKIPPAHFDIAYVRVEIKQWSDAYGESHYLIELRPFGRIQVEHVEDELSEFWTVPV